MGRAYEVHTTALLIGGIIAAGLTSLALLGDYTYHRLGNSAWNARLARGAPLRCLWRIAGGCL
jgi:hypothetical protein